MLRHKILEIAGIKGRDILVGSLGYPNTGKSSVINGVAGKHKASTSPVSGHTKGLQLVNAGSRIMFIDTPGVIPFGENDQYLQGLLSVKSAAHLEDPIGVAMKIIEKMCTENKSSLESFYQVTIELQNRGYSVKEKIVRKFMKEDNLLCVKKRFRLRTTDSNHGEKIYPNLSWDLKVTSINQLWVADRSGSSVCIKRICGLLESAWNPGNHEPNR